MLANYVRAANQHALRMMIANEKNLNTLMKKVRNVLGRFLARAVHMTRLGSCDVASDVHLCAAAPSSARQAVLPAILERLCALELERCLASAFGE